MNLQTRVVVIFLCLALLVIFLVGVILPVTLNQHSLNAITKSSDEYLKLIDYSFSDYLNSTKGDVYQLSLQSEMVIRNNRDLEKLSCSEKNYMNESFLQVEDELEETLYNYYITHQHVNYVYFGTDSGDFIRSPDLSGSTAGYDPRERPWYTLAEENPESVVITEPYLSLTSSDLNLVVAKALTDEKGSVYGVVGAGITLAEMGNYLTGFEPIKNGKIVITDSNGTILSEENISGSFGNIDSILKEKSPEFLDNDSGVILSDGNYLIYRTSPGSGWKIGVIIPSVEIQKETNDVVFTVLVSLILSLVILGVLSILVLNNEIIRPLSRLTKISRNIAETGDLNQDIPVGGTGEIFVLADAFRKMVGRIKLEEEKLNIAVKYEKKAKSDLKKAHAELEEKVTERTRELAEANENLKNLDSLKSMFIASMSHELRTPLNSIIGFTVVLLKGWSGEINDEQKKQLKIIENSSRHLLSLINDVIDISKIEADKIQLSITSFDLVPLINDVILSFREAAEDQNIEMKSDLPETLVISGDERRVRQILINFVSNALKFTDAGKIMVKAGISAEGCYISVKDTGIGIPEDQMKNLFKAFSRISTEGRLTEGTGLGLYLSNKLALALKGRIVASSTPGKGSEFILILPLKEGDDD
ncbi:signal transduction histidine kinase [Methanomicrobium sp. W14]|uniref:hybrid sensor histidine kinase/response regulator n=1 Tax=Methanomicrobium sp. W14 TaxID=2817839 RepID=UPI001AE53074|nr:hybrid sensor histidine kinase/response regulator [Methanomicrobium sp. W14]MBP2133522.1 signal transduction histidine kinase [Methanomicrobium sp. W14]